LRRRKAFTLVELLVVIAIIAILIAILLPVCIKIRNRALVLASPIAYVGDDGGVYLTGPKGGYEVRISPPGIRANSSHGLDAPLGWSACGRRLAYHATDATGEAVSYVHEPSTGKEWRITGSSRRFSGWIDYNTYLGPGAWGHAIIKFETGDDRTFFQIPDSSNHYDTLAPAPACADGRYVAACHGGGAGCQIAFVNKNFLPAKVIWRWPDAQKDQHNHCSPQVDPTGEYAAWPLDGGTAVRRIGESSSAPLTMLPGTFCDWTEDGNVLINEGGLSVYSRDGKLMRKIPTEHRPVGVAAYRKYGHK